MVKKESVNNKVNELLAVSTFGQIGKVDGVDMSPQTAKAILAFYEKLETVELKKQFLLFDAKTMKTIAMGTVSVQQNGSFNLTPEAQLLVKGAKISANWLMILKKKLIDPLFEKKKEEEYKL